MGKPDLRGRRETQSPPGLGERSRWDVVRGHLRGAFVENAALKFVAFVLALTVFILVQSDEDVYVGVDVGVSYLLPEDRVLVTDRPDQIRLTVKGSRRQTRRFSERELDRVYIDLRHHRASEYAFRDDTVQLPDGLELVRFSPESFRTEFERRTEKEVPVEVRTSGSPRAGWTVAKIAAEPAVVVVRGAESQVLTTLGVKTQEIRLGERSESFEVNVPLVVAGETVDIVDVGEVRVRVTLAEEQGSRAVGPLTIKMRPGPASTQETADRFVAEPAVVNVVLRGSVSDLQSVDARTLDAYVEIYNEDVTSNRTRKAAVIVRAPEKVALEISPPEVTIHPKKVK